MGSTDLKNSVFIKHCEEYDRTHLQKIMSEGMARFGFRPRGNVMVKPNVVFAYNTNVFGDTANTHRSFVGAALVELSKASAIKQIDVGENSGVSVPTRLCYKNAGYYDEMKRARKQAQCKLGIFCMDEEPRDSIFIGGVVHDNLRISRKMARADAKVYLPKLKCHCVSKMTGAVKLNIGICSDDERSIRHDFMLNEKIVDLLSAGYPDFIIMDAIDVGMGNETLPTPRKLGVVIMGTNPLAVDIVGSRLLGLSAQEVPYLKVAIDRGYTPASIDQIAIHGDLNSTDDLDEQAKRLMPYDDDFFRWQDIEKELKRMNSPMRFFWGPYRAGSDDKCLTGCIMGLKIFLTGIERFAGTESFAKAKPVSFVIGRHEAPINANGEEVYLIGSCAKAEIRHAKKVIHLDKCFTTASDMNFSFGHRLGIPSITRTPRFWVDLAGSASQASCRKIVSTRYLQDIGHFIAKDLIRRI